MVERTEDLTFYHGTGTRAARAILKHGANDAFFEDIGARELGREVRRALLDSAGLSSNEDWRLHTAFVGPGADSSALWVSVLRQLEYPEDSSLVEYGHFFATLNIANAYRYAIANPYRSEFILAVAESLKVLTERGHSLPESVATRYPEVSYLIQNPSPPVVLELYGIARERLLNETGGCDIEHELEMFREMQKYSGANTPAALRIRDVASVDVIAVHDLSDWPSEDVDDVFWRPDPAKVAKVRHAVKEWLD